MSTVIIILGLGDTYIFHEYVYTKWAYLSIAHYFLHVYYCCWAIIKHYLSSHAPITPDE